MNVPVRIAAKVYEKDPAWIRAGLIFGWLPIGYATKDGKIIHDYVPGRINYYISPKKLYEDTGFMYEKDKT